MVNAKTQQGGYYPILQTGTQRSGKAEALFKVEEQESISEKCLLQKKKKVYVLHGIRFILSIKFRNAFKI